MSKQELIKSLAKKFELSNVKSGEIIKYIFESIENSLKKSQPAVFVGFGSFSVRKRSARKGYNPKTGEPIKIPARKAVHFSVGKALKEAINKK